MKKIFGVISVVLIVGLLFISCGKKEEKVNNTKPVSKEVDEPILNTENEEITNVLNMFETSLENADFDVLKECMLKDSKLYKKVKMMSVIDALYYLGYDKSYEINLEDDDWLKILNAVGNHTTLTINEIIVDNEKATVKAVINKPDYDKLNNDGGVEEFLNSKGLEVTEIRFMSYDDYSDILKGYVIWFEDIKLPSLKKFDEEKTFSLVKTEGKWKIEEMR